jgi:hypothetical protein
MANLFFPQLESGALAQYPIDKTQVIRTIKNVLADGSNLVFGDPTSAQIYWQFAYTNLSVAETNALRAHFDACAGRLRAFTFIDPTGNMLASSIRPDMPPWEFAAPVQFEAGHADPAGGSTAFVVTNTSQAVQDIKQTVRVPANYHYCFSIYAAGGNGSSIQLVRKGTIAEQQMIGNIGPVWTRVVSSGRLNDTAMEFSVAIRLAPGQQIQLYGPQLEAQLAPSRYRATARNGAVYAQAHWAVDDLVISAEAPNLFSTAFSIETSLQE